MSLVAPPRPPRASRKQPTAERVPADVPRRTDPDAVRAALGAPSRRAVVRTGVWSVPVVAAAMAAPAFAASPPICGSCSGSTVPQCLLSSGSGTGTCRCAAGLVCVGTGPLGLANVCVGSSVISNTCGGGSCFGVCLATGGSAISAINTLISGVGNAISVLGCTNGQSGAIPTNICASPVSGSVGNLGALCVVTAGTNPISAVLSGLISTLTTTLNGTGLGPASSCASPYSCKPGVRLTASNGVCLVLGFSVTVGFCQC